MPIEPLEIQLLGDFQVRRGSQVIPAGAWKLRKAAGIVKLLALEPGHRLHREQMLDTLWPELDPDAAANNFRYALHRARATLDPERSNTSSILFREGNHLVLAAPENLWVDVAAFESAVDAAWRGSDPAAHRAAAKLYRGDLLPDDRYEEWLDARRTALRTNYLALLNRLAGLYQERDERESAIEILLQLVAADPLQEEAHARLMLIYAQAGKQREALAQYDRLVATLETELGVEPDPVIRQLAQAVRAGQLVETSPVATPAGRTNLRVPVSSLVGRERELAEAQQTLAGSRLVTLTGPGGIGKTRLALAVAAEQRQSFADGVFVVMLAPLSDPGLLATTIIQTLGIRETGDRSPAETLLHVLSEKALLLVLDNFEQIVAAAPLVATLLEGCPRLKVVVTSRMSLRVRGEQEYPVRPLGLPDLDHERSLMEYAATALFVQRSREVKPAFDPGSQTAVIADICRQLDGMPLAIELAAAHSKVLAPVALLARLEHPLNLLTGGTRDLPERQQTLRNTIDWSYDLLGPEEQRLFRALSVFRGGWTLEAAEAVGAGNVLDGLTVLVESSLVEQDESSDGEPRFRMLETIREFGLEHMMESGEADAIMQRHASHFADTAELAGSHLETAHQGAWLSHMESDDGNINAVLQWCRRSSSAELGLRLITALRLYWFIRGRLNEGYKHSVEIVGLPETGRYPALLADALNSAGFFARFLGKQTHASELVTQSLAISRRLDDPERIANALANLGYISLEREHYTQARVYYAESLASYRQFANKQGIADTLSHLAVVTQQEGDLESARKMNAESLALWEHVEDREGIAWASYRLAIVSLREGHHHDAYRLFAKCLTISMDIRFLWGIAWGLEGIARLAMVRNQPLLAVRVLAAASHVRDTAGIPVPAYERHDIEVLTMRAREKLDSVHFDTAWTEGLILSPEEVIREAERKMDDYAAMPDSTNDTE